MSKMKRAFLLLAPAALLALVPALPAQQASPDKVAGVWNVEVAVDTEVFYLTLTLRASEGGLEGAISESYGSFTDVPIADVVFDGTGLNFGFAAPTPPDGLERAIKVELKILEESKMEGILFVPDMGLAAPVKAARQ
jgi:hypothetical protein